MTRVKPHPRAVVAWSFATITVALATTSPAMRGLAAVCAFLVVAVTCGPRGRTLMKGVLFVSALTVGFNVFLSHAGADVVAHLPDWLPIVGGELTVESALFGGDVALGLSAALLAAAPMSLLVAPGDLVNSLPRALERSGTVIAGAARFVPQVGRGFREVREAQTLRGWQPNLRSWSELLVPVMLTALEDSIQLAESMEARAYGSGRRVPYRRLSWTVGDTLVVVAAAVGCGALVLGKLAGAVPDWAAYPTPEVPSVGLPVLAATLLLALPAAIWRSHTSAA